MIRKKAKRLLACGLSIALAASSLSALPSQNAAAAKKASVKLVPAKASIQVGKTKTLKVKKTNVKKIKSTTWSTNKKKIATVNKKGKVTAKAVGSAKITAKVKYIPKGKKKAVTKKLTCKVTVKAANATPSPSTQPSTNPSTQPAVSANPSAAPSAAPTAAPTSNVGEPRQITQSDGTVLTVKDNGYVRKNVTAQYIADNEMKTGINLGNTMEGIWSLDNKHSMTFSRTDYDMAWRNPNDGHIPTTRAYIELLHSYGINTIRIPVAWSNGDKDDGTYTIDPLLLNRIEEIANYALDLEMYVVINDHWDNQWWGQFGACKLETDENGKKVKVVDQETRDAAWARYEKYWVQIAEHFKGYSDHLIFEGANEELGDRLNDTIVTDGPYKGYSKPDDAPADTPTCSGNLKEAECYALTNEINQKFVDIIRGSGGNNANRFLLIPGYNTDIEKTCDKKDADGNYMYQMPKDTDENGKNKLFLSVHYYTPTQYALDGGSGEYTEEDRKAVPGYFEKLKRFSDEGYAIIVGECAVCQPSGVVGGVIDWYTDVFTEAAKYHAVPCIWDTGAYFDRTIPEINYKDVAEFLNEWNGASGTTEGIERNTGGGKPPAGTGDLSDFIDKELWETPAIHAYLFYQTNGWDHRNAYMPIKNLAKNEWTWNGIKDAPAGTSVTDVNLTEDGAEYTVKLENIAINGTAYNMLGVSTNIDHKDKYGNLDIKAVASSLKIDGTEYLKEPTELTVKPDDQYFQFMFVNKWDKVPDSYPLFDINEAQELPPCLESIEVTFTISGIEPVLADLEAGTWINPETGLPMDEQPPEETEE